MQSFLFSQTPQIHFGEGKFSTLPDLVSSRGRRVLLVTGHASFASSSYCSPFLDDLKARGVHCEHVSVKGEPGPDWVDRTVQCYRREEISLVVSIGGGSAIDAGKAICAMLPQETSVWDYLEGIGQGKHDGRKTPFIAVPTTFGTGSEASKNAVLSVVGPQGFKRSIRHERFIPDVALIDPILSLGCPPQITAACGLDAFTQLLESYLSPKSNPITDAIAWSGLQHVQKGLESSCKDANDLEARSHMAYASLVSGITLANAGLGIVHGLASVLGGMFEIPHGVICGTLLAPATRMNIRTLKKRGGPKAGPFLQKYARVGALLEIGRASCRERV